MGKHNGKARTSGLRVGAALANRVKKDSEQGPRRLMVGLTGYPNVGKSSTINALFGSKKTAVAATPGKTKHFQTLNVTERLTLCDCPGLVLAKYAASKAEMVAAEADRELMAGMAAEEAAAPPGAKPKRAAHKFNKKPARTKGLRGLAVEDAGVRYDGAAFAHGKRGGLVRVAADV
ncbi:hypothetical protein WJX72_008354 [[Myrmecia] bisecta]|uniref:G domain-containing protein n=1 Tax=[Myrmecia] bisecta TaxID=41462 RepID=A0AAW1PPC1_9CHLO